MTNQISLEELFHTLPLKVKKYENYFPAYEQILQKYRNQEVKVLEIGVLDGGSLLLWRRYLGSGATIVGVDINPRVTELESKEFDLVIGDQGSKELWQRLKSLYGQFDIIIDDGGHTNRQQLLTLVNSIDLLKDGGKLVVEDTHCSYMSVFGNPSRYSFVNFAFKVVHKINSRFFDTPLDLITKSVFSIAFYESLVVLEVNRLNCKKNKETSNFSTPSTRGDHRYKNDLFYTWIEKRLTTFFRLRISNNRLKHNLKFVKSIFIKNYLKFKFKKENVTLRKYFK
jgi:hypothetical protein